MSEKQKRNELCPCGSQKKYKKCCAIQKQKPTSLIGSVVRPQPFVQGLANRVFTVMGSQTPLKQVKDLQSLKND